MNISVTEEIEYLSKVKQQVYQFRKEVETDSPEWVQTRRMQYLEGLLTKALNQLVSWKLLCGRLASREKEEKIRDRLIRFCDLSPFPQQIVAIKKQIKFLASAWNQNTIMAGRQFQTTHITRDMIEKARVSPLAPLLAPETVRKGKMICPWHNDKHPSMSIHRGGMYAHCFVCNKTMDAISYMRIARNMSFYEAVKALQ